MPIINFQGAFGQSLTLDTEAMRLARLTRRINEWARAINGYVQNNEYQAIGLCLTYDTNGTFVPYAANWSKRDISDFMCRVREFLGDKLLAYAWVAEMQERGVPHYHVTLIMKPHFGLPFVDASWRGRRKPSAPVTDNPPMWVHGSARRTVLEAVSASYLTDYIEKGYQKHGFPKSMRIFAVVIRPDVADAAAAFFFRLSSLAGYVRRATLAIVRDLSASIDLVHWKWEKMELGGTLITYRNYWRVAESEYTFLGIDREPRSLQEIIQNDADKRLAIPDSDT